MAALIAVAVVLLPVGHVVIGNHLRLSESTMSVVTRFGGHSTS